MDVKTALLIAFGLAFGLPYITVALLEGAGTVGIYLLSGLFFAAIAVVVWADIGGASEEA